MKLKNQGRIYFAHVSIYIPYGFNVMSPIFVYVPTQIYWQGLQKNAIVVRDIY